MDESTKWSSSRFSVRSTFVCMHINDFDTGLINKLLKFADDTKGNRWVSQGKYSGRFK